MCQPEVAPVLVRNKDVEHIVNAAANFEIYARGEGADKRFSLLITTDVHRCQQQLQSAVDYLDGMEALDAGICLGDIQGSDYAENDGCWYTDSVNKSEKPFFTAVGNHDGGNSARADISGTKEEVFRKFIAPTRKCMGLPQLDKTYYAINFDEYKITLIVLDNYDVPDDRNEEGNFIVSRSVECIGQEQADWLVSVLAQVPPDYHVLIARHSHPDGGVTTGCSWTTEGRMLTGKINGNMTYNLVPDIVEAWRKGTALEEEYLPQSASQGFSAVKVKADFRGRGQGIFIGYIVGHEHWDWLGKSAKYPEQNIYCFAATANDKWQNFASDLPRRKGTKAEDCLTVMAVDYKNRHVCLVRIGSNFTNTMTDRTFIRISY